MATCKSFKSPFLYGVQAMAKTVWSISFDVVTKQTRKEMYADAKKPSMRQTSESKDLRQAACLVPLLNPSKSMEENSVQKA